MKKSLSLLLILCLVAFAPLSLAEEEESMAFGAFSAESLNGDEPISEEVFASAAITLVNYWATWCGPCIDELPDLAQLSELTNGNVQVIGVMLDAVTELGVPDESAIEAMELLLADAEVTYPVVAPDEYLAMISTLFQAVPTTVVVDRNGDVQDLIVGSRSADEWIEIAQTAAEKVYGDEIDLLTAAE